MTERSTPMFLRRPFALFFCVIALSVLNSGCWATLSELKKERYLRKELEKQFQEFKRTQLKKERLREEAQKRDAARLAAVMAKLRIQIGRAHV